MIILFVCSGDSSGGVFITQCGKIQRLIQRLSSISSVFIWLPHSWLNIVLPAPQEHVFHFLYAQKSGVYPKPMVALAFQDAGSPTAIGNPRKMILGYYWLSFPLIK